MQRWGEIILIQGNIATVRIYKDDEPSGLTLKVRTNDDFSVTDFVNIKINAVFFIFSVVAAYLFPFIVAAIAYTSVSFITENIAIIQVVLLLSLAASYFLAVKLEENVFFKALTVGEVIDYAEQ